MILKVTRHFIVLFALWNGGLIAQPAHPEVSSVDSTYMSLRKGLARMIHLLKESKKDSARIWFRRHYYQLNKYHLLQDSVLLAIAAAPLPQTQKTPRSHNDSLLIRALIKKTVRHFAGQLSVKPEVVLPDSFIYRVTRYIRLYRYNEHYRAWLENTLRRSLKFRPLLAPLFKRYGFPDDILWFVAVESAFNPNALSPAGAAGMFQFMPATARQYGLRVDEQVDERFFVMKSARAAAAYLKDLYLELGDLNLAFAAYNTGPNKIRRLLKQLNHIRDRTYWQLIAGRNALKNETRAYLPQIYAVMTIARDGHAEKLGFRMSTEQDTTHSYIEVIDDTRTLKPFSDSLTVKHVLALNPDIDSMEQLYRESYRNFPLRLPSGVQVQRKRSTVHVKKNPPKKERGKRKSRPAFNPDDIVSRKIIMPTDTLTYAVKRGNTLNMLARIFHTTVPAVMKLNRLRFRSLRQNMILKIRPEVSLEYLRYRLPRTATYLSLAERFGVDYFDLKHINSNKSATVAAGDTVLVVRKYKNP